MRATRPTCPRTVAPDPAHRDGGDAVALIPNRGPEMPMPTHLCIDPTDQYSDAQVLVTFKGDGSDVSLISVINAAHDDILPDLEEIQRQDLRDEITAAVHRIDGPLRRNVQSPRA
ncbi:hypothetical protein MKK69_23490 [Methylobacterium sp. J-026]|uniref:hypothetical protein n=1 Tax=Methylobacterium sp. J-026 TaxID=2836624 RepID=UPI001FBBBF08|nr:hypothetical protein [Methylobacterium sp. J-026]MCJ2136976.1 hypothetical protein [Methylobacterium sp. J-026]